MQFLHDTYQADSTVGKLPAQNQLVGHEPGTFAAVPDLSYYTSKAILAQITQGQPPIDPLV
jgi:hypothetical protein